MVSTPGEYPWSSYRFHALGAPDKLVLTHERIKRLGNTDEERRKAYRSLFRRELNSIVLSEIRDTGNRGWPLGSNRFKDEIAQALKRTTRPPKRGRPVGSRNQERCGEPVPPEI
jgi:putative transposase